LITHAASLRALGAPVVLAGDYNVVPRRGFGRDGEGGRKLIVCHCQCRHG
jgi:exonuclease III